MKMTRHIFILMTSVLLAAGMTGCSVNEDGIYGSFPYLEIEELQASLTKSTAEYAIPYSSNRKVSAKILNSNGVDWLKVAIAGEQIVLKFKSNDLETERCAKIQVSTTNNLISKIIEVTQDASGELTMNGDLILSDQSIKSNNYTKTTGNLIIGNIKIWETKSNTQSVTLKNPEYTLNAGPSDITDIDLDSLTKQIHEIQKGGLVIANTKVKNLPIELIKNNRVKRIYFDYNEMADLPAADVIKDIAPTSLSLRGNKLSDISELEGCSSLKYLDISDNDIHDLNSVLEMPLLEEVILDGLPITNAQLEIFKELFTQGIISADNINTEASPLVKFGEITKERLSDTEIKITVPVVGNATDIGKVGFYIGTKPLFSEMTFHESSYSDGRFSIIFTANNLDNMIYFIRAYAENTAGASYSDISHFGSLIYEGNYIINSVANLSDFYTSNYSHINGSMLVGKTGSKDAIKVTLDNATYTFTTSTDLKDLSDLSTLTYVRDGLYIINTGLTDLSKVSHIEGIQTLDLRGNALTTISELACKETLKDLNVSRNALEDFSFLDNFPKLERIHLGSTPIESESNVIAVLTGLEKYTNLKHIELSGLPIHQWQVDELKEKMPNTTIAFVGSKETPYIPNVLPLKAKRKDNMYTIRGEMVSLGKTEIIDYGFYYGKDLNSLEKVSLGSSINQGDIFTYDITVNDEDVWYYYPYAVNKYGESRCDAYSFTKAYEDLSINGTANCYIASGEGKYKFNATVKGNSSESVGEIHSVEVLWETKNLSESISQNGIISEICLNNGYIEFEVAENISLGNALIAVKDASGKILWSWHIWVTEYDPIQKYDTYKSGAVLMDRNLGAAYNTAGNENDYMQSLGTLYQWGRKDPFIAEKAEGPLSLSDINSATEKPTTLAVSKDWVNYISGDNTLWSDQFKSVNDPCPAGWMVADSKVFLGINNSDLSTNSYGILLNNTSWIPYLYYSLNTSGLSGSKKSYSRLFHSDAYNRITFKSSSISQSTSAFGGVEHVRCMKDEGFYVVTSESPTASATSIEVSGEIISKGTASITDCGFVWTTVEDKTINSGTYTYISAHKSGNTFSVEITGLQAETEYWIRAYVKTGTTTRYGAPVKISTAKKGSIDDGFTEDEYEW